jgi:hypothetical protein
MGEWQPFSADHNGSGAGIWTKPLYREKEGDANEAVDEAEAFVVSCRARTGPIYV